jgi:hypothetical protein
MAAHSGTSSRGWNYRRLNVETNAGSVSASVYVQTGGQLPWSPRFYMHNVHRTWTAIQCDAAGAVLAITRVGGRPTNGS